MFNYDRYQELHAKQIKQQPLTPTEFAELSNLSVVLALNPSLLKEYQAKQPKQVLFTDAAPQDSYKKEQQLLKERAVKQSGNFGNPVDDNIFISKKEASLATGLTPDTIKSAVKRGQVIANGNEIEVNSLVSYISQRLEKSWTEYLTYSKAAESLN